jgi:hypothetical protein
MSSKIRIPAENNCAVHRRRYLKMEIENESLLRSAPRTVVVARRCRHEREGVGTPRGTQRKAGGPTRASIGAINFGEFDFLLANATNTAGIAESYCQIGSSHTPLLLNTCPAIRLLDPLGGERVPGSSNRVLALNRLSAT